MFFSKSIKCTFLKVYFVNLMTNYAPLSKHKGSKSNCPCLFLYKLTVAFVLILLGLGKPVLLCFIWKKILALYYVSLTHTVCEECAFICIRSALQIINIYLETGDVNGSGMEGVGGIFACTWCGTEVRPE